MADRRDLDPAPPARRPATAAAAPPAPDLGGPGTARGPAQRDTESAASGAAAAGHSGHDPALAPRHRPVPLGCQIRVVRHERRTSLTASPGCWHAYPVRVSAVLTLAPGSSPWRLQSAHGGTPAYVTDGDGRAGMRRARSAVRRGNRVWKLRRMAVPERDVLCRAGPGHLPVAGFPSPQAKKSRASGQDSLSVAPGGTPIQRSSRSRTSRVATLLDPG